jgi:hypothetical protein
MQESTAMRKDTMETPLVDQPLGYAEFHLRGMDGGDALITKANTYADLHTIIGRLPVGLIFEIHLYCNRVRVGSGTFADTTLISRLSRKVGRV